MKPEDLLLEIRKAIRDEGERIIASIARSYPQKTTLKKNSRPQLDFSTGQWIVPDELRAEWLQQYPAVNIDAVLAAAAQEMDGRKKRPPRWAYERWMRPRLRKAQAEALRSAMAKRAIDERPSVPCSGAACEQKAAISVEVDGVRRSFCLPCADAERARQLRAGATYTHRPSSPSTEAPSSPAIEASIARIGEILGTRRPRTPTVTGTDRDAPLERQRHHHAAPAPIVSHVAQPPEREPGCDDE